MKLYTVNKLAKLAKISIRTLHYYDQINLLKPGIRTEAAYRLYGEKELIRLQQILFFRELDFDLIEIKALLDDTNFSYLDALIRHKETITIKQKHIQNLVETIDKTIDMLKGEKKMKTEKELYSGFTKEQQIMYKNEAKEKYGSDIIEQSEKKLTKLNSRELNDFKKGFFEIENSLTKLMDLPITDLKVIDIIVKHIELIKSAWPDNLIKDKKKFNEAYIGLAQLYLEDKRFFENSIDGFREYLSRAMLSYISNK